MLPVKPRIHLVPGLPDSTVLKMRKQEGEGTPAVSANRDESIEPALRLSRALEPESQCH